MTAPAIERRAYESYQELVRHLADTAAEDIRQLWERIDELGADLFIELAAIVVTASRFGAAVRADAALSAALTVQRAADVLPTGLAVDVDDSGRITAAIRKIVAEDDAAEMRLGRLAVSETYEAGAEAWHASLRQHGVERWTRRTTGRSCPACVNLADGTELPVTVPMFRHKGCDCVQQPITTE